MSTFIPPGLFGVVVVVITGLILVALVTVAILAAAVSRNGIEDVPVIDPEPQHGGRILR